MLRIVVLISGAGSNLNALLEAVHDRQIPAEIVAVGADRDAAGLAHARRREIETFIVKVRDYGDRQSWGQALLDQITPHRADLVILSGFMRLLPSGVVAALSPRIINTHPAYLPEFPGAWGVRDALAAKVVQTGASLIIVNDGVDTGPVISQERVPVFGDDTEESLHERIKPVERRLLIDAVESIAAKTINLEELART